MLNLPPHLQKYIVEQDYEKYTAVDQACWRYILRQLKSFLSVHAHECYLEGLEKTGIEIEKIPHIKDISKKLEQFGWRALPVSGFIPPAAFMELQSLGVLPIASDMRTVEHLQYTPAPDIVHEAAGHAPILVNPEFANYLKQYALVAKKAIISKEDLDLYAAIRDLSDLKENPKSSKNEILQAQEKLDFVAKKTSHVSEAAELGRMNWWTSEYGLIGDLKAPKIFGAGLLSSVGESRWCLSDKVKKIPLTLDCIKQSYDITEPQPQLFVAPDFKTLGVVLDQMAAKMAFSMGGRFGLEKAIMAQTVNTVQLDTGIQISGQWTDMIDNSQKESAGEPIYIRTQGPTQLCLNNQEIFGHSKKYHAEGYGMALGKYLSLPLTIGKKAELKFASGILIQGLLKKIDRDLILSFDECTVTFNNKKLFEPSWGTYDLALGTKIVSVFGGPADRLSFSENLDFVAKKIPPHEWSPEQKAQQRLYADIRKLRESKVQGSELESTLTTWIEKNEVILSSDWLLLLEVYELAHQHLSSSALEKKLFYRLKEICSLDTTKSQPIEDGLRLA